MSTGWGGGYVTDVSYEAGYYHEQSPGQLRLACVLSGAAWDVPAEGAHYLELGCGVGLGALVIAAANPTWRITGLDFNPGHIAAARALARETGLDNITFIEADLGSFAESPAGLALPEADIVTAHGVWSWVAPPVQAGIVRLLRAKLRAGGVFHVSYNALPGWQNMLAVQRLVRDAGRLLAGRSDRQAQAGIAVMQELAAAEALSLRGDARHSAWLAKLGVLSSSYLAHELMNGHWAPCWHGDVVAALAEARLDFAGSAALVDNFPELAMGAAQREVYDRFDDPAMRELIKDVCSARTLRHDVFVRGMRRLSPAARDATLRGMTLALAVPEEEVQLEVQVSAGMAELAPAFYRPVVTMLAKGPARVAELLHAPGAVSTRENPAELAGLLTGTRQAVLLMRPRGPVTPRLRYFNAALAERLAVTENLKRTVAMASEAVGGGIATSVPELFVAGRAMAGEEPAAGEEAEAAAAAIWADQLARGLNDDARGRVAEALRRSRGTVKLLRELGCLD